MSNAPPGSGPQGPAFGQPGAGPPNPYAAQGPPGSYGTPQAPPSHFGSYWWAYALAVPAMFFLCCCGGCFVLPMLVIPSGAAAYEVATKTVKNDPQVQAKLGTPLETSSFPAQSNVQLNNNTGEATFKFTVTGPQGEATINAVLTKNGDDWKPTRLNAKFDDNSSANLLP